MKLLLVVIPFLTACTVLPSSHSPTLYNHVVELSVLTTDASRMCGNPNMGPLADALRLKADVVSKYTLYTAKDTHEVTTLLAEQYREFASAYTSGTPTETYCKLKTGLLVQATDSVLEMMGNKPNE